MRIILSLIFVILTGCAVTSCLLFEEDTKNNNNGGLTAEELLDVPRATVKATVISLSNDPPEKICKATCKYRFNDKGVLRVTRVKQITSTHDSEVTTPISSQDLLDQEIHVDFRFGHRVATVRFLPSSKEDNRSTVSTENLPPDEGGAAIDEYLAEKQDNRFIFEIERGKVDRRKEVLLPGLSKADEIQTTITFFDIQKGEISSSRGIVSVYSLLSNQ